jgi:chromosome segregation ATPase
LILIRGNPSEQHLPAAQNLRYDPSEAITQHRNQAMTGEELERAIKFIIDRDAALTARIEGLTASVEALARSQVKSDARLDKLAATQAESDARLTARIDDLARAQAESDARLDRLAATQAESDARLSAKFDRLLDFQAESDARLSAQMDELRRKQAASDSHTRRLEQAFVIATETARLLDQRADSTDSRMSHFEEWLVEVARRDEERAQSTNGRLDALHGRMDASDTQIADLRKALAESELRVTRKIEALAVAQKDTDSQLKALAAVVERYISEGRNGKSHV